MPGDSLAPMVLKVRASADQFNKDMQGMEQSIGHFAQTASSGGGGALGGIATGFGIGAGVAAFTAGIAIIQGAISGVIGTLHELDDLGDFAQRVGTSVDQLQALHFAADQLGSSGEAFDQSLQKMVNTLGKARAGSDQALAAFENLGFNVDELAQRDTVDAFEDIAQAISELPTPADRAAAAVAIFGKQGAGLLGIMADGAAGIDKMRERAEHLGLTLSEQDAAAAGEAADAIDEMLATLKALVQHIIAAAAPAIKVIAKAISELVGFINKVVDAIGGFLRTAYNATLGNIFGKIGEDAGKSAGQIDEMTAAAEEFGAEQKRVAEEQEKAAKEMAKAHEAMVKKGAQLTAELRTPMEKYHDTIADVARLLKVGAINWDTFHRAVAKANDELEKATDQKEKLDKLSETPGIAAVSQGSAAGFSAVQAAIRAQVDAAREQVRLEERQLSEQQRTNEQLAAIRQALRQGEQTQVVGVGL